MVSANQGHQQTTGGLLGGGCTSVTFPPTLQLLSLPHSELLALVQSIKSGVMCTEVSGIVDSASALTDAPGQGVNK
ncbi:hypothetical protein E2C01_038259 [Portunus trituberculatus]|uniref:Uncharacterized protein n=1 Tax=Portunus trituberculatus TaxID=210409 RepID=A0A5B7FDP8_PORTR|nr:hypothetical protein [Portunus trituberculatus]